MTGISVIIAAFNAAGRIGPTLEHLAAQQVPEGIAWELIVVDNNSTDDTSACARATWERVSSVPLRVAREPEPGVAAARACGVAMARYDLVGFIDDDNWVDPHWVATAVNVMTAHPEAGACGGCNTAHYETEPPSWLPPVAANLAIGPQGTEAGDITDSRGLLWGAGLVVRRQAWLDSGSCGVEPALAGRIGTSLMAGEDSELCLRLRVAGWRLWYDPRLRLTHAIGRSRLTWSYIKRLYRGAGAGTPLLDAYYVAMRHTGAWTLTDRLRWSWPWQALRAAQSVLAMRLQTLGSPEGAPARLAYESMHGRLLSLLRLRGLYSRRIREGVAAVRARGTARSGRLDHVATRDVSHAR